MEKVGVSIRVQPAKGP